MTINNIKMIYESPLKKGTSFRFSFLLVVSLLMATSCSKKLQAGDPLPLTYSSVYLVGDATPIGWSIATALPMTKTSGASNLFTWTGPLTAGEIKFPTALSWSSDTFMAVSPSQLITNNKAQLCPGGNPDIHWKLSSTNAGIYKITLNTLDFTVVFQKQ